MLSAQGNAIEGKMEREAEGKSAAGRNLLRDRVDYESLVLQVESRGLHTAKGFKTGRAYLEANGSFWPGKPVIEKMRLEYTDTAGWVPEEIVDSGLVGSG